MQLFYSIVTYSSSTKNNQTQKTIAGHFTSHHNKYATDFVLQEKSSPGKYLTLISLTCSTVHDCIKKNHLKRLV